VRPLFEIEPSAFQIIDSLTAVHMLPFIIIIIIIIIEDGQKSENS